MWVEYPCRVFPPIHDLYSVALRATSLLSTMIYYCLSRRALCHGGLAAICSRHLPPCLPRASTHRVTREQATVTTTTIHFFLDHHNPYTMSDDPMADFLAREKAALGEDADFFANPTPSAASGIDAFPDLSVSSCTALRSHTDAL